MRFLIYLINTSTQPKVYIYDKLNYILMELPLNSFDAKMGAYPHLTPTRSRHYLH